jgi:acetylornithine deacetylase/succinyl-diaminopimelate desuccinylase family protein
MSTTKETLKGQVLDRIAAYRDDMLQFTQQLVAIATENPPGVFYKPCVDAIRGKLMELELDCEIIEVPDTEAGSESGKFPRYCILSHYGAGERTLYFHGHYDVVPAVSKEQFQPYVKGGNLFGRGSSDMKSGLAAMIYAIKAIQAAHVELDGQIGLTIVPDEETGGKLGSQYLSKKSMLGRNGIGMLLAEPTGGVIWNANRGAISLRVNVKGKPAHVGLQYRGINAFEQMLKVANALLELKQEVESRSTDYNLEPAAARQSILMLGGRCEGGSNFNLVPGECFFTMDRRINPEEDLEVEKKRILEILERAKLKGIDLEVEILQEGESAGVSESHPLAQSLARNIEEIKGSRPKFELCPGLLENRFYVKAGVPAFAYGPGLLSVSHGPSEFVKIEEIYNCASIFALTALDVLLN